MPQRSDSETVIARLRAHGLVPPRTTVRLVRCARTADSSKWKAVDGVTGADLGIASATAMRAMAAQRHWALSHANGTTFVEPEQEESDG